MIVDVETWRLSGVWRSLRPYMITYLLYQHETKED